MPQPDALAMVLHTVEQAGQGDGVTDFVVLIELVALVEGVAVELTDGDVDDVDEGDNDGDEQGAAQASMRQLHVVGQPTAPQKLSHAWVAGVSARCSRARRVFKAPPLQA